MLIWVRRFFAIIEILFIVVSFVVFVVLLRVNSTFLNPHFYINQLRQADIYNFVYDKALPAVLADRDLNPKVGERKLELEGEPLIFREETSGTQQTVSALLAEARVDIERWLPHLVLGSHQVVVSAVEAGAGIAFVSNLAIKKSLAFGLVRRVAVQGLSLKRDFYCVYRKERLVSRLLEEFISFVRGRTSQG